MGNLLEISGMAYKWIQLHLNMEGATSTVRRLLDDVTSADVTSSTPHVVI